MYIYIYIYRCAPISKFLNTDISMTTVIIIHINVQNNISIHVSVHLNVNTRINITPMELRRPRTILGYHGFRTQFRNGNLYGPAKLHCS